MHKQIQQLNEKLSDNNLEIIRLKKENQVLKLQANMVSPVEGQEGSDLLRAEY